MPSVATIESVLRLSAPVQLRVSVPVQLRVSAPVSFDSDQLPREQSVGKCLSRIGCRERRVEQSRECLCRIGWSIGCRRAQSGAEQSGLAVCPRSALPESASSRQRVSVPDQRPFPDWLVDWLPPTAEWRVSVPVQPSFSPSRIGLLAPESVCPRSASFPGLAGRLAATERRVEGAESVCPRSALPRIGLLGKCLCRIGWSIGCHRAQSGAESVCPCSTSPVRPPGQDHPFGLLSPISLGKCLSQIGWSIGCRRTQSEAESVCPRSACFCCAQRLSVLNQFLQSVSPRGCLSRPSPDHPGPVSAGGVKTVELISVNCSD